MPNWSIAAIVIAGILLVIGLGLFALWRRLPALAAAKMRAPQQGAFGNDAGVKYPKGFSEVKARVEVEKDLSYPSVYPANRFDLYYPRGAAEPLPVLLWVHGGGFIGGVKEGVEALATLIADSGFAVVSMDYAVAPEHKYPTAVRQVREMTRHLISDLAKDQPVLDASRVFLGGDSAGGQIASQYAALETSAELAASMKLSPVLPQGTLKGIVLISAPTVPAEMLPPVNFKLKLLQAVWNRGYFGAGGRKRRRGLNESNVQRYVTPAFPPAYLTDGNHVSFEAQNRALAEKLRSAGVAVTELYFPKSEGEVNHEYVFEMDEARAPLAVRGILDFLAKRK